MTNHHMDCCENAPVFICQHCGRTSELVQSPHARLTCPHCGSDRQVVAKRRAAPEENWSDIARVSNLAEAGFLADDLQAQDMEARIYQTEEFSAAVESWSTTYVIQVPTEYRHAAADRIRAHAADDDSYGAMHSPAMRSEFSDIAAWRPLAVVMLASVASFAMGQRIATIDGPRRPGQDDSLSTAVRAIGRPLLTERVPGKPRFKLSVDRRHELWQLEIDGDNDGHFEARHRFPVNRRPQVN